MTVSDCQNTYSFKPAHSIGNGEVHSSTLCGSTILSNKINIFANVLKIAVGSKCRTMQENASILSRF